MIALTIEAADTLFFRDGRPFTMGEDTHAAGFFPPPPSVLYGALRSAYLSDNMQKGKSLDDLIVDSEELIIRGLWLIADKETTNSQEILLPLPKDLVVSKGKLQAHLLNCVPKPVTSSYHLPFMLLNANDEKVEEKVFFIDEVEFESYLAADGQQTWACRTLPIVNENKIGIGRQKETHIATDGMLYRTQMQRLQDQNLETTIKIGVQFDKLTINTEGVLQLGGERKVAFTQSVNNLKFTEPDIDSDCFKIYLATPAIFKTGWQPTKILKDYGLEIIAAAIGKPLHIGGWDVKAREPKPMLQAIPAGSVYYVKAESIAKAQAAAKAIHEQSISEFLCKQGFGIALAGKIYPEL